MSKFSMEGIKNHKKGIAMTLAILALFGFGVTACDNNNVNNNNETKIEQSQELSFSFIAHDKDHWSKKDCDDHSHEFMKLAKKPHEEIITHCNQDLEYLKIYKLDEDFNKGKKIGSRLDIEANKRIVIRCNIKEEYPNMLLEFKVKDGKTYRYIPVQNDDCESFDFVYVDPAKLNN